MSLRKSAKKKSGPDRTCRRSNHIESHQFLEWTIRETIKSESGEPTGNIHSTILDLSDKADAWQDDDHLLEDFYWGLDDQAETYGHIARAIIMSEQFFRNLAVGKIGILDYFEMQPKFAGRGLGMAPLMEHLAYLASKGVSNVYLEAFPARPSQAHLAADSVQYQSATQKLIEYYDCFFGFISLFDSAVMMCDLAALFGDRHPAMDARQKFAYHLDSRSDLLDMAWHRHQDQAYAPVYKGGIVVKLPARRR
ncbi:hypothetical protein HMI48_00550 [Acidithiobacillus ferrooxidans]|uniref:hypothetical protein n=1 Tax=Acidithiobacillus ferrooxidans TaxID=920 RepID=UPI001C06EB51|nr:hypothetical protein [Acidithiobacillus ferrooxidans]MBU2772451.1 hypothetical protein [Acidithiobacillus ferrooxidans]